MFPTCATWQVPAAVLVNLAPAIEAPTNCCVAVHTLGISPAQLWGALAAVIWLVHTARRARRVRFAALAAPASLVFRDTLVRVWAVFLLFSIVSSVTLPFIFEGVNLYTLVAREGVAIPVRPLSFGLAHLAQIVNALGLLALFLLLAVARHEQSETKSRLFNADAAAALRIGVVVAGTLAVATTLAQRAASLGYGTIPEWLFPQNPSYEHAFGSFGRSAQGWAERASLPFIEPSYASITYAALSIGLWIAATLFIWQKPQVRLTETKKNRLKRYITAVGLMLISIASVFALFSSRGNSGILAFIFGIPCSLALLLICKQWRALLIALLSVAFVTSTLVLLQDHVPTQIKRYAQNAARETILKVEYERSIASDETVLSRSNSNRHALFVLTQTYGLGAGMGSNRASGYFHSILSNLGIVGAILLLTALGSTAWRIYKRPTATGVAALTGLATLLVGVGAAVSDQNWPVLWAVIALCVCETSPLAKREEIA